MKKDRKKKVAIISRESNDRTLDIAMLEAELIKRGIEVRVLCRLLTKDKSLKALGYAGHVLRQEAVILDSDAVVLDTYCIPASMIPHRRGTKVIQIWHALSAIKKFGWQTVGKEGGSSEKTARLMRMHRGYDHVAAASDITAGHFCEAFDVSPDRIVKYGLPRIDYIRSVSGGSRRGDTARRIYSRYPMLVKADEIKESPAAKKKTVLYAPTFRRGKAVDVQSLIDALDPERYDLVVKLHPLYRIEDGADDERGGASRSGRAAEKANIIYDDEFSSFDWLSVADIVISDYSSFVIESTLADRPLFIYAYDLEEYADNTGLNIDFENEAISPYVFRDADKLAACMDEVCADEGGGRAAADKNSYDMEALHAFRDRYIDIDTGEGRDRENYCTERLADFIESLL